jgi:hypothetical protein
MSFGRRSPLVLSNAYAPFVFDSRAHLPRREYPSLAAAKTRRVAFQMPKVETAQDLSPALAAVAAQMADGTISRDELSSAGSLSPAR